MIPTIAPPRSVTQPTPFLTRVVDLVGLAMTLLVLAALLVPGEGNLPGRPGMALLVVTFVPGWAALRLVRAPMTPLSVLGAFALSVSLAMLASLITVAWLSWQWQVLAIVWMLATASALGVAILRPPDEELTDVEALEGGWAVARPYWRDEADAVDIDPANDPLLWLLTIAGALITGASLAAADPGDIDGYGLLSALPQWYFVGLAMLLLALFGQLRTGGHRGHVAAVVNLGLLIVALHGAPGFVESAPRFPVAWLHAGFADHIAYEGELYPQLDARFSWAGFFSGVAFVERVADTDDVFWLLRFAPVVVNAVAALAVFALARAVGTSTGRSIAAATIFVFANWIGQDYFAPQAVGFVLVTTVLATVLTYFGDAPDGNGRVARWVGVPQQAPLALTKRSGTLLYAACLFVCTAVVASHQLSPPMLVAMLAALALLGRIRTKMLGAIVGLGFVLWLSHAAETYWVGHLNDLLNQFGDVGSVINSNVSERARPGSPARELVVRCRLLLVFTIWLAGVCAIVEQRRRRALDPALAAMFFSPFVVLGMQSYGGEVLMRVALFTLPAASILIARVQMPVGLASRARLPAAALAVIPVIALSIVAPLFVLARFGNESYEQVTPNDRAVVDDMYDLVPDGSRVYVVNRSTLMYADRLREVQFRDLSSDPVTADQMLADAERDGDVFVLVTEGQEGYRHEVQGAEPGWLASFASQLMTTGSYRVVSQRGPSVLLERTGGAG